jgi:hypothetical protein
LIHSAVLSKYRIKEFIQFISNILIIVKKHDPEKLKVKALYKILLQNLESLEKAHRQEAQNEITTQLALLDEQRDRAIICLRQVCDGYTNHSNPTLKAAGQKIVASIDKYGNKLYSLNYGAETTALKQLVHDLQHNPECVSALQALQMEEVVKDMHTANVKFETLFVDRLEDFSQDEIKSTRELIRLTTDAYKTLMQHIDAHAVLAPSGEYTSLVNHINENIEHYNLVVERRKNGVETEEADTTSDEAVETPSV